MGGSISGPDTALLPDQRQRPDGVLPRLQLLRFFGEAPLYHRGRRVPSSPPSGSGIAGPKGVDQDKVQFRDNRSSLRARKRVAFFARQLTKPSQEGRCFAV
jgi:hypothetical protein